MHKPLHIAGADRIYNGKIGAYHIGCLFFNIHALRRRSRTIHENYAQHQRYHDKSTPSPVPAKIGPCQTGNAGQVGAPSGLTAPCGALHIAERINRRRIRRLPHRLSGTDNHGQSSEQCRAHENHGRGSHIRPDILIFRGKCVHNQRKRQFPNHKTRNQPRRNSHKGKPQRLPVHKPFHLTSAHTDRPVEAEAPDLLHHGNVKHIIDQQIAAEDKQRHEHGSHCHELRVRGRIGDCIHDSGQIVRRPHILRISPYDAGKLIHFLLQAAPAHRQDVRPVGSGHFVIHTVCIPEDIGIRIPKRDSCPHHAELIVQGLIPAGHHHGKGISRSVGGKCNRDSRPDLRLHSQITQRPVGCHHLVFPPGHLPMNRHTECQLCLGFIQHVKLDIMKSCICQKTHRHPKACLPDQVRAFHHLELLLAHIPEIAV